MPAVQLGIRHRHQAVAVHRRDRAGEPAPTAEVDVDVIAPGVRCPVLLASAASCSAWSRISVGLAPAQLAGRQRATAPLGIARLLGVHAAADMSCSIRSPTVHCSRLSSSTGMASSMPSTSQGSVKSSARKKPLTGSLEEADQVGQRYVVGGWCGSGVGDERRRSVRSPAAALAAASAVGSKVNGCSDTSSPGMTLRYRTAATDVRRRCARAPSSIVVASRASSSSASGTAGGRGWPMYSSAPV